MKSRKKQRLVQGPSASIKGGEASIYWLFNSKSSHKCYVNVTNLINI